MIPPRFHEFSVLDFSLKYSYIPEESTSLPLLIILSTFAPLVTIILVSFTSDGKFTVKRILWDIHCCALSLSMAIAIQLLLVCILKNIVGLPRPDMLQRCEPMVVQDLNNLTNVSICTNPNFQLVIEGFRTFPSGHSSTIFTSAITVMLYSGAKLSLFDGRATGLRLLVVLMPLLLACIVSCSRISDNRHFLRDVIAGSILGIVVAIFSYHYYFPSVYDLKNKGKLYNPRKIGTTKGVWSIDEEEDQEVVEIPLLQLRV